MELTQLVQVEMTMMMMKDGLCSEELKVKLNCSLLLDPFTQEVNRDLLVLRDSVTCLRPPQWADC